MTIISLDRIAARLLGDGIMAEVQNTGGGVMCLFAGTPVRGEWSACAGPGWTQAGGAHLADTSDFYVGPDDERSREDWPLEAYRTAVDEDTAVAAIKAQVAETDTVRAAVYLMARGRVTPEDVLLCLEAVAQ